MPEPRTSDLVPVLAPEAGVYCTGEEALRLTALNADADTVVTLTGRFRELGRITPIPLGARHVPATDRTASTLDIPLGEGWLTALTAITSTGAPPYAQTFIRVDLIRGLGASATVLQTLLQGPVSALTRRAWPGSPLIAAIEGPGALRSIAGTNPAADVEIVETVPTGARWRLLALAATLVTDATAANREVSLTFDDGTTVYAVAPSGVTHTASLTRRYSFARHGLRGAAAQAADITVGIPDLWLPAGHRVSTVTTNRQATDNYGAPQLLVEEHLEAA